MSMSSPEVVIETERLVIRDFRSDDKVAFQKIKQAIKTVRTGPGVSKPKQKKSA